MGTYPQIKAESGAQDVVEWQDGIPLTPDGLPDTGTMRALGLDSQADEWNRRMRAVSRLETLQKQCERGEKSEVAERVASEFEVSSRTVYRWRRLLEEGGPVALVPNCEMGKGETSTPYELQRQVREFWLNSRRASIAQVYRELVLPYYEDRNADPVCYATVRRFLNNQVLPIEKAALRQGPDTFDKDFAPKVRRELPPVGAVWSADHRLWDVLVVVSDGNGAGWGNHDREKCPCESGKQRRNCCSLRRPWLTVIADVGSAAFVGWRMGTRPTAAGVCHAVRSAILDFGLPQWFCPDQGKEFRAKRLRGKQAESYDAAMTSGLWRELDVEVHPTLPYQAWAKPVESLFSAFSRQWENLCPGWTGRNTEERPEALERQIRNGMLLFWKDFEELFAEQIFHWNRDHTCGEREDPPLELYTQHWSDNAPPRMPSLATLNFLLQDMREVKVHQDGITLADGGEKYRFFCEKLALYVGCKVQVRWDPEYPSGIFVYTPDRSVLAVPPAGTAEWGEWGETNEEAARAERLQRSYIRERMREVLGSVPEERFDPVNAVRHMASEQADAAARGGWPLPEEKRLKGDSGSGSD